MRAPYQDLKRITLPALAVLLLTSWLPFGNTPATGSPTRVGPARAAPEQAVGQPPMAAPRKGGRRPFRPLYAIPVFVALIFMFLNAWADQRAAKRESVAALEDTLPSCDGADHAEFFDRLRQSLEQRFDHGWGRYTVMSNGLLWLAGLAVPRLSIIQETQQLFRHSDQAVCSQVAQALVEIATGRGLRARLVGLDGHVVAEAWIDNRWQMIDPDYGVAPGISVEQLVADPAAAAEAYSDHRLPRDATEVLEVFARGRMTVFEEGATLAPRLAQVQAVMRWLNVLWPYAVPVVVLLIFPWR